jgi:hypothetical protein
MQPTLVELGRNSVLARQYGGMLRRGWLKSLPGCGFYWLIVINASFLLINNLPSIRAATFDHDYFFKLPSWVVKQPQG